MIFSAISHPPAEPLVWLLIALLSGQSGLAVTRPAKAQTVERLVEQPGQPAPSEAAPSVPSELPAKPVPEFSPEFSPDSSPTASPAASPDLAPAGPTGAAATVPAAPSPAASIEKDIFAVRTWLPPPPPVEVAAPQAPQTPALPFQFIGRIHETGKTPVVLLNVGNRVAPFIVGQIINSEWRLTGDNGRQLVFRYRPLNTVQTLNASQREIP